MSQSIEKQFASEHEILEDPQRLPYHPNIVRVLHSFNGDATLIPNWSKNYDPEIVQSRTRFVVLPFMPRDLQHVIVKAKRSAHVQADGLLPQSRVLVYAVQLLRAAQHLKLHKLVHRDLKPDNLMAWGPNNVYLTIIDFGFVLDCKHLYKFRMSYEPHMEGHTALGGAPANLAPEILGTKAGRGVVLDFGKNDAWAAGLIIWRMMSSDPPFISDQPANFKDQERCSVPSYYDLPDLRQVVEGLLTVSFDKRMEVRKAVELLEPHFREAFDTESGLPESRRRLHSSFDTQKEGPESKGGGFRGLVSSAMARLNLNDPMHSDDLASGTPNTTTVITEATLV